MELAHTPVLVATIWACFKFWVEFTRRVNRLAESYKPEIASAFRDEHLLFIEYNPGLLFRLSLLSRFLGWSSAFSLVVHNACLARCEPWDGVETRLRPGSRENRSSPDPNPSAHRFYDHRQ